MSCSLVVFNSFAHLENQESTACTIENVLESIRLFYDSLSPQEQDDSTVMFDELLAIGGQVQDFCDTYVKHNNLMLKYKQYKNNDMFNLNVSFGCTKRSDDPIICRDIKLLDTFDYNSWLQSEIDEFHNQLNDEEQQELKVTIIEMFTFCKNTICTFNELLGRYPAIKNKLEQFMNVYNQEFLITIGFDYPFPSIVYKVA